MKRLASAAALLAALGLPPSALAQVPPIASPLRLARCSAGPRALEDGFDPLRSLVVGETEHNWRAVPRPKGVDVKSVTIEGPTSGVDLERQCL